MICELFLKLSFLDGDLKYVEILWRFGFFGTSIIIGVHNVFNLFVPRLVIFCLCVAAFFVGLYFNKRDDERDAKLKCPPPQTP
jgi:hypothetical protein